MNMSWTNRELDWLQVGIMLQKLFPEYENDPFISKLKNEGETGPYHSGA